jgi:hypothetical protein
MKPGSALSPARLRSGLLLALTCTWGLACVAPAFAQEDGDGESARRAETRPVHSRSAETKAKTADEEADSQANGNAGGQSAALTLKAGASYTVPRGTSMNLKIVSVPTNGMHLLQKDLEGNPMPAKLGDVISAMITEDIYVDGDRVIPEGTVFRGHVVHLNGPRRVQRPGWVDISFNELELPSHRIFRFKAEADNLEASTLKSKMHGVGMVAANAAGGAIVGTMVAYQLFGMHNTAAVHGYNLAAGAAGGAILAAGHAIMKRGHAAWLEPGDGLNLSIDTDMVMPALTAPTKHVATNYKIEGLSIDVLKRKVIKNGIGGYFIRLDVNIDNDSNQSLQSIDLYLKDTNGNDNPLAMGPEFDDKGGSAFVFRLEPNSSLRTRLYFDVEHPKLGHEFVWYSHEHRKIICFRQKLEL